MISRVEFRAMGCQMEIQLDHPSGRPLPKALAQSSQTFADWEACLTRFREDSELSRLNRSGGTPTQVSEVLWQVLQAAIWAEAQSAGLVSAAVLDAVLAAGYTQSFEQLAAGAPLQSLVSAVAHPPLSLREIRMDPATRTVSLPEGMHLDFGGVGKGWAAHQAAQLLEPYGQVMVDAGGDLALSGMRRGHQAWMISIEDPRSPGAVIGVLRLGRGGVATSGIDYRRWQQDGKWRHHIIDPRTGQPAETDVLMATVIAPTVMEAEMAAKVVLILGSRVGLEWLMRRPNCAGLVVLQDGRLMSSPSLQPIIAAADRKAVNASV